MSADYIVVADNVIQTIINYDTNIVSFQRTIREPIISAGAQGPQGIPGVSASTNISSLTDVVLDNLAEGALLVYSANDNLWVATTSLDKQGLECGQY